MPKIRLDDGLDMNLVRTGPRGGAPLVLLHALGLDLTWWSDQVAAFGDDHDIIALDLPGHGQSSPTKGAPTFEAMAGAVAGLLASLGVGPVHLVGISMSGMVAQLMAITRPELVRSLGLVATSCTFPGAARQAVLERARATRAGGMEAIAPLSVERWFPPAFRVRRPDILDRATKTMLRQDPEFHARLWEMVATLDLETRLAAVSCPTLVVAGAEDASASAAAGQLIVDQIAGARLHVVAGSGHFPPLEAAAEFNQLLRGFLATA